MLVGDQKLIDLTYVTDVLQKCSIEVDEEKVVATGITKVELGMGGWDCEERNRYYHDIVFNRPFIFIIAVQRKPIFIGLVTNIGDPTGEVIDVTNTAGTLDTSNAFKIRNIKGKINVRDLPSTSGNIVGSFEKDEILTAYETKSGEGYTWYRIGTNRWVADKNGEWIRKE